ncbi:MAG: WD40 repeat domain-containing protein, partial [Coriobacteriia bacterium]
SLAFSRDGRWLASGGGDGAIKIWRTHEFREEVSLRAGPEPVLHVAFSPTEPSLYASGGEPGIHTWSSLLAPFSRFDEIAEIAQLGSLRDVMQCTGGASVVLRAHRLMARAVQTSLARLARIAAQRGRDATSAPPRTQDLEDAAERLISVLRAMVVEASLREPLNHEIAVAEAARADLPGHAMLGAVARLVEETEEQLVGLESADDPSCQRRLEGLRVCEERALRWRASLPARHATAIQRADAALQRLTEQIPELVDLVLARQAAAIVARVAPIADQEAIVSVRRLHDLLRRELDASTAPAVDDPGFGPSELNEVPRGDILSDLEKRYRAISSELEAVMEVDDILQGNTT